MIAGAATAEGRGRTLAADLRPGERVASRVVLVSVAAAVALAVALSPADQVGSSLGTFAGRQILHGHLPLALGTETFTAAGASTGGVGWLGSLTIALLVSAGPAARAFATIVAAFVAVAFVELRARRNGGPVAALAAPLVALACFTGSFGFASGIVTAAFSAVLAYVLERPSPRAVLWAVLLTVLWCNVAAEGILAPLIALCAAGESTYGGPRESRRWSRLAVLVTVLALFATPAFYAYPAFAFEGVRLDRDLSGIAPYHPIDVAPLGYRVGFTLVVMLALAFGVRRGREATMPQLIFGALLALGNGAFVPVFGVLAAPLIGESIAAATGRLRAVAAPVRVDLPGATLALACAFVAALAVARTNAPLAPGFALAAAVADDGRTHRLYCSKPDWCDAALEHAPQVRVFMDGRVGAYPAAIWNEQRDVFGVKPRWLKVLRVRDVDTVLVKRDGALASMLMLVPGWHLQRSDSGASLFERVAPE